MIRLLIVVGTRPNYIKVTRFKKVAEEKFKTKFDIKIVHTGQHFDKAMADDFFRQLDIYPDFSLNIPRNSANNQIGEIMIRLEEVINTFQPHLILVPGDVNSTLAAAITANKMGIPLGHLESGLRSCDRTMPEEINRLLVDEITDYFFVTEQSGIDNLIKEGKPQNQIHFVGNTMIDTLVAFEDAIKSQSVIEDYELVANAFILMTIHRPATVDHKEGLEQLYTLLKAITQKHTVVFPMHPRTLNNITKFDLKADFDNLKQLVITGPLDYFSFQNLIHHCKMVLTDSGGIQEETTFKLKPCLTLRPNTERPITITEGSNTLLDFDIAEIMEHIETIDQNRYKDSAVPQFWDGKATERILEVIENLGHTS
ncbi:non-hydrolyzing UDP-N-acetylglucosamine 2-epimerase [Winogradskyella psychrotolerans]|uniref:non-hydrolyzing UDP-N-acetylglucosamine 2-epimerase n=1 Tax=Winogradskyella psychrotolerans TaxID=1344585 RepID=UPI001C07B1F9|nr:UDP-N-acetylglucosamine 2-epimerase (non-hydrolyzing) [Winogradskyella psychrotolerans]MBU2927584.1 UDP-N-acetylglucosamine 2-epimerase (non-hydrolyzing) [Winogradskyella psychrotolerans]